MWRFVAVLVLLLPSGAAGQPSFRTICANATVDQTIPDGGYWRDRFPDTLAIALQGLEAQGEWSDAFDRIAALFVEDEQFFAGSDANAHARVRRQLEAIQGQLSRIAAADQIAGRVTGLAKLRLAANGEDGSFSVIDGAVRIDGSWSIDQVRSLCYLGHSMTRYADRLFADARAASALAMQARVGRWDAFLQDGVTPYPWELALNEVLGWTGSPWALEPPAWQVILLRPSPAVDTDDRLNDRTNLIITEVLGIVIYGPRRRGHFSIAGTWVSPAGANAGLGISIRTPWITTLGVAWRDTDDDGRREPRLLLSLDAFDLLANAPSALRDAAARATGGRIGR